MVLREVHFDSDHEVSCCVCTIVPYSSFAIIVHIHAVCTSAVSSGSFRFGVILFFCRVIVLDLIHVYSHAFVPLDTRVRWRRMVIGYCSALTTKSNKVKS